MPSPSRLRVAQTPSSSHDFPLRLHPVTTFRSTFARSPLLGFTGFGLRLRLRRSPPFPHYPIAFGKTFDSRLRELLHYSNTLLKKKWLFGILDDLSGLSSSLVGTNLHKFSLAKLKVVCQNFNTSNYVGEGGFRPVFKGFVDEKIVPGLKGQSVAVKQMDLEGVQGHKEWLTEVILLGQLRHPHLVKLIGYCYEDEHRMLIYEYMTRGSLDNHLFNKYFATLPWKTRIRIAIGAAKGLPSTKQINKIYQVILRSC